MDPQTVVLLIVAVVLPIVIGIGAGLLGRRLRRIPRRKAWRRHQQAMGCDPGPIFPVYMPWTHPADHDPAWGSDASGLSGGSALDLEAGGVPDPSSGAGAGPFDGGCGGGDFGGDGGGGGD